MEQRIGLLGCDREMFAQVWRRVSPGAGCPVEVKPMTLPAASPGKTLRELVDGHLCDAAVYAALARMNGRGRPRLAALSRKKTAGARRLCGAYFLASGLRYWPQTPPPSVGDYFPALRRQFFRERALGEQLSALAQAAEDADLEALYQSLWQDAQEAVRVIRELVEE